MPLIRHADKLILFVHVPKTGGTSIEVALQDAGAKIALLYGSRIEAFSKTTLQHINAHVYEKIIPVGFYDYSFAIVRHPFTRLVSEYYQRRKYGFANLTFDDWLNAAIDHFPKDPYTMDNHFRPQVDFIRPTVEVFKLEDGLDKPLAAAAAQLGLVVPERPTHANQNETKASVSWTIKTRARTIAFYKDDFDHFGYDPYQNITGLSLMAPKLAIKSPTAL